VSAINDIQLTTNFRLREFQCRHCGTAKLDRDLLERLQALRTYLRAPVTITSGYRCPEHNAAVGGSPGSQHVEGTAADIRAEGYTHAQVADAAELFFHDGGLGRYSGHTHVDVRGHRARWEG